MEASSGAKMCFPLPGWSALGAAETEVLALTVRRVHGGVGGDTGV